MSLRLLDLEPQFFRAETRVETTQVVDGDPDTWRARGCPTRDVTGPRLYTIDVESMEEAQGVRFLCPKCFGQNGGAVGTHSVLCWFKDRGVPDAAEPSPRWAASGTSLANLTLSPSVLLLNGCAWHGFITAGGVVGC